MCSMAVVRDSIVHITRYGLDCAVLRTLQYTGYRSSIDYSTTQCLTFEPFLDPRGRRHRMRSHDRSRENLLARSTHTKYDPHTPT